MINVIYFDIDNTLIDTKKLTRLFFEEICKRTGTPIDDVQLKVKKYIETLDSSTDFKPEDLLNLFSDYSDKIKNLFEIGQLYKDCIFSDTEETLKRLSGEYKLGIFSEGYEDYQTKKLKYTGILKYFDKNLIVIERRKLANKSLNKVKPGTYIVDDKKEVVEKLLELKAKNFGVIWINRKTDETIDGLSTVKNLSDLIID